MEKIPVQPEHVDRQFSHSLFDCYEIAKVLDDLRTRIVQQHLNSPRCSVVNVWVLLAWQRFGVHALARVDGAELLVVDETADLLLALNDRLIRAPG